MSQEITCEMCNTKFTGRSSKKFCNSCVLEKRKEGCRLYKQRNKEKISTYNSSYKSEHKKEISTYNKEYDKAHREEIQARQNEYQKNRRKTDHKFKMIHLMRTRMNKFMKGQKVKRTSELLGCTRDDFILWMKYQFDESMTIDNHGEIWHYDHVIPCSLFDHSLEDEQEKCWHWSNIQPMLGSQNMSKQNTITKDEIIAHIHSINSFIDEYNDEISDQMTLLEYDRLGYANS